VLEAFTGARRRVEAEVPSLLSTPLRVCEIVLRGGHLGVPRVPAGFLNFPQVFSCSDRTDAALERYLT
jgi:hypothetical protein